VSSGQNYGESLLKALGDEPHATDISPKSDLASPFRPSIKPATQKRLFLLVRAGEFIEF
jgi:hypothetical protein